MTHRNHKHKLNQRGFRDYRALQQQRLTPALLFRLLSSCLLSVATQHCTIFVPGFGTAINSPNNRISSSFRWLVPRSQRVHGGAQLLSCSDYFGSELSGGRLTVVSSIYVNRHAHGEIRQMLEITGVSLFPFHWLVSIWRNQTAAHMWHINNTINDSCRPLSFKMKAFKIKDRFSKKRKKKGISRNEIRSLERIQLRFWLGDKWLLIKFCSMGIYN